MGANRIRMTPVTIVGNCLNDGSVAVELAASGAQSLTIVRPKPVAVSAPTMTIEDRKTVRMHGVTGKPLQTRIIHLEIARAVETTGARKIILVGRWVRFAPQTIINPIAAPGALHFSVTMCIL